VKTRLTRRQLFMLIAMSAAPGCRARERGSGPDQQATEQTVTLIVDGMI
jgi:hypothetical protein